MGSPRTHRVSRYRRHVLHHLLWERLTEHEIAQLGVLRTARRECNYLRGQVSAESPCLKDQYIG